MTEEQLFARGKRPHFFKDPELDAMMTALLEVMSQTWAVRDRTLALEKLLVEKGLIGASEIDELAWSPEEAQRQFADQQAFLKDAFRAVSARMQSLDERERDIDSFQKD